MNQDLVNLALKFGKTFDLKNSSKVEYLDGVTYLLLSTELSHNQLAIHNLAHFLCAAPQRRLEADFGLGSAPDTFISMPSLIPLYVAQYEEELTVYLSKIIANHLNINEEIFDHDVTKEDKFINQLRSWNILDHNNNLTMKMREEPDATTGIFRVNSTPYDLSFYSPKILEIISAQRDAA